MRRLLLATNFGSTGRNAGLPDYSDFIVVDVD